MDLVITSIALVMVTLDNLVVTTALPVIRTDLGASTEGLEWTVNAYTLTFAVFLLTGAALGDRFSRRRLFVVGLGIFNGCVGARSACALDRSARRRTCSPGIRGAIIAPLTLTILSAAVPAERRGLALGAWGGIGGLAVALGPLVGGAVIEGLSWQWIFWINVPIGLALDAACPAAPSTRPTARPRASTCVASRLPAPACSESSGAFVRGNGQGWTSPEIVASLTIGALLVAFVLSELRAR